MIDGYHELLQRVATADERYQFAVADAFDGFDATDAALNEFVSAGDAALTNAADRFGWLTYSTPRDFAPPSSYDQRLANNELQRLQNLPFQVKLMDRQLRHDLRTAYRTVDALAGLVDDERDEQERRAQAGEGAATSQLTRELKRADKDSTTLTANRPASAQPWSDPRWPEWDLPQDTSDTIYLGKAWRPDTQDHPLPALVRIPGENVYLAGAAGDDATLDRLLQSLIFRVLAALPAGAIRLTFIDAATLGESVGPVLELSRYSGQLVDTKVWTSPHEIEDKVNELIATSSRIIQKYLTGRFETIADYNAVAQETAEPYRLLVVNNFPVGFNTDAARALADLMDVGPRCGITTILRASSEQAFPQELSWQMYAKRFAAVISSTSPGATRQALTDASGYGQATRRTVLSSEKVAAYSRGWLKKPLHQAWDPIPDYQALRFDRDGLMFYLTPDTLDTYAPTGVDGQRTMAGRIIDAVGRGFGAGSRVEVTLERVFSLLDQAQRDAVDSHLPECKSTDLSDVTTWWTGSSRLGIAAPIGRMAGSGVLCLPFDSQLLSSGLLAGRPGAGKSTLLHAAITSLSIIYPPEELELYLLDFKEGVEFMAYANERLPHARVVAIEAEREFGVSVLEVLNAELEHRGNLFRATGGEQASLVAYRESTGETLPRTLMIIDEFHKLFDRDDKLSEHASRLLDNLVRQGRGFGMHCLLASQTMSGLGALGRHTINQIPIRVALQCSDADSRLVLNEENGEAQLLTRPGEGIYNAAGGLPAHNEHFQAALLDEHDRVTLLRQVRDLADRRGHGSQPRVFKRGQLADLPGAIQALRGDSRDGEPEVTRVDLGQPMSLVPALTWRAKREGGANLLVVGRDEDVAASLLTGACVTAVLRNPDSLSLRCIDFMTDGNPFNLAVAAMADHRDVHAARRRNFAATVQELATDVAERQQTDDYKGHQVLLVINGLGRARDLDVDELDESTASLPAELESVLRDGPEVGIHTIIWCDSVANLDRRLSRAAQREFSAFVTFNMSADDSMRLIDTQDANTLREGEALFFDSDRGLLQRIQPFAPPDLEWVVNQLKVGADHGRKRKR